MVTLHITNRLVVINVELYKESILETLATEIALVMIPNVVCGIWSFFSGGLAVNSNATASLMIVFDLTAGMSVVDGEDVKP